MKTKTTQAPQPEIVDVVGIIADPNFYAKEAAPKAKKAAKPTAKVIEAGYVKGRQSVEFRGIYKVGDFKLKVAIDRDSYDFQSSAAIYVWRADKLEWSKVTSLHYTQMASLRANAYRDVAALTADDKGYFDADRARLMKLAAEILF